MSRDIYATLTFKSTLVKPPLKYRKFFNVNEYYCRDNCVKKVNLNLPTTDLEITDQIHGKFLNTDRVITAKNTKIYKSLLEMGFTEYILDNIFVRRFLYLIDDMYNLHYDSYEFEVQLLDFGDYVNIDFQKVKEYRRK